MLIKLEKKLMSKTYSLLSAQDLMEFCQLTYFFHEREITEVIEAFSIFHELGVNRDILLVTSDGYVRLNEHGLIRNIPIIDIFNTTKKLFKIKHCENFQSLAVGFSNPTQFRDTMFEVDCIHFINSSPLTRNVKLEPKIIVNDSPKKPDFSYLDKNGSEIFCECKSLCSTHRAANSKAYKLIGVIEPELNYIIPAGVRVEINFRILPPTWNRNYAEQLRALVQRFVLNKIKEAGDLSIDGQHIANIKLCASNERPYFKGVINASNKKGSILISEDSSSLIGAVKDNIKDALTQLPNDKITMILLYSINERYAQQAIDKFFYNNQLILLKGIYSWTTHPVFHQNPNFSNN